MPRVTGILGWAVANKTTTAVREQQKSLNVGGVRSFHKAARTGRYDRPAIGGSFQKVSRD